MALSLAEQLQRVGMPTEQARLLSDAIAGAAGTPYTDEDAVAAVAAKTEVAALDGDSTAPDIVTALQA